MTRRLQLSLTFGLFLLNASCATGQSDGLNQICGPRCVHWISKQLGNHDVTLEDAVESLVDLRSSQSVQPSLFDLSLYLKRQGFHTRSISFPKDEHIELQLDQDVFILAHLRGPLVTDSNVKQEGHFIVWLGTAEDGSQQCWDGLRQRVIVSSKDFQSLSTGLALAVAPSPVGLTDGISMVRAVSNVTHVVFASFCAVFVGILAIRHTLGSD